ncbi:hemolysin family protein [Roseiflexus sp.]|uniref:hemolysin family protein n=1 Tax=Roseiflexus sp. TaxID=2562120 RepID=UPI00398B81BC
MIEVAHSNILFESLLILLLIIANGFFAASEIAIVSARKGRLEQQAERGDGGARAALALLESPGRFLSTVQVGITLFGTFAAVFGGASIVQVLRAQLQDIPTLAPYAGALAPAIVALIISYASLIVGELVPKRLALQNAELVAAKVAPFMGQLARLASPAVMFLTFSTEMVLRLLGRHNVAEQPVTEDDIMALVREGAAEGTVADSEQTVIHNVFKFSDRTVRSLMTPRTQITAIDIDTPLEEALKIATESGYSRIPVYEETLDHVIGILYVKDLLPFWGRCEPPNLRDLLRPPMYVIESQRAAQAFQQLKQNRNTLAIVLDEYGQVAGVITIEDMLEELVGDISDEYDEVSESIVRRDDGSYLVDGLMPFADLHERLRLPPADALVREHGFETLAGFVLALLGRIPNAGDSVMWEGYSFEVVDMDGRRIDKVLIVPPRPPVDQTQRVLATRTIAPQTSRSKVGAD